MRKNTTGQMRLQRESRIVKKQIQDEIKKNGGKYKDNYICLPDPENVYHWYYIVMNLDSKLYKGGYYMGVVECPEDYPSRAPKIKLITDNGHFHTTRMTDGICLSISHYHPESWNPAWRVS